MHQDSNLSISCMYREIGPRISNLLRPKYMPHISNHCYHGQLYFHFLFLFSCAKYEYNNIDQTKI